MTRRSRGWARAADATLTPGIQTYTSGAGQCTTNFVFTDRRGAVYLGQAAHCATTGGSEETNGCRAGSLPLGTRVTFNAHGTPLDEGKVLGSGTLAYSSWIAMKTDNEKDASTCAYNDLALVKVDAAYVGDVNPTVPFWGGPTGIDVHGVTSGESVHSYGDSSLRLGATQLSPQTGEAEADDPSAHGWSHQLHSPTPGIPGDSGSAYLDDRGRALGVLSTLGMGIPVVNNIGDVAQELRYARRHSGIRGLALELGTASFRG